MHDGSLELFFGQIVNSSSHHKDNSYDQPETERPSNSLRKI